MSPLETQNNSNKQAAANYKQVEADAVPPSPDALNMAGQVSFQPAIHYGMEQEGVVSTDQEAFELLSHIFNQGEEDLAKLKTVERKLLVLLQKQSENKDEAFSDMVKNGIREEARYMKSLHNKEKMLQDKLLKMGTSHKTTVNNILMDGSSMHKALQTQIGHQSKVHSKLVEQLYITGQEMNGRLAEKEAFFEKKLATMKAEHEKNIVDLHYRSQELIKKANLKHLEEVQRLQNQMKESNDRWTEKLQNTIQAYEDRLNVLHKGTLNTADEFGKHHSKVMKEYEEIQRSKNERFGKQIDDLQSRHEAQIANLYQLNHEAMSNKAVIHANAMEGVMREHNQEIQELKSKLQLQNDNSVGQKAIEAEKLKLQTQESAVLEQINKLYPDNNSYNNNLVQAQSVSIDDLPHTTSAQSTDSSPSMATWQIATIASFAGIFGLVILILGLYKCCAARKRRREEKDRRVVVSSAGTSGDIQVVPENCLNKKLPLSPDDIMAIEIASEEIDDKKNQMINNSHTLNVDEIDYV